jgi:hypothetical protein
MQTEPEWLTLAEAGDRVGITKVVLVAVQSGVTITVSCVERERWGYRARHPAPSDFFLIRGAPREEERSWTRRDCSPTSLP